MTRIARFMLLTLLVVPSAVAQSWLHDDGSRTNRSMFRPIEDFPDPTPYRNGAGMPGPAYWQQRADYVIEARLDTLAHRIHGSERITYHNNSPDVLRYLWVQLDQNVRSIEHSRSYATAGALPESMSPMMRRYIEVDPFDGGYDITRVQLVEDGRLVDTEFRINDTVMRVELSTPLEPGARQSLEIDWSFVVPDGGRARGAKERVRQGWLYDVAQWFPRMSVYDDVNGWQTDQFLGRGEFYLNFGDYDVKLTVPWDHILDATGLLQNPEEVLTSTQRERLARAYTSEEPVFIVSADEVGDPSTRPNRSGTATWHFRARNVRDFAWASSKAFVWDAAGFRYRDGDTPIRIHSLYPREAMPLWDKVSTRATLQTMKTYGRMAFEYPYPKAINVNGPVGGMEYPMVAFCGARPEPDGSYSDEVETQLIMVTIHEVGHNWFPMIVASDERKWTWMDEGLNSFLQYYGEQDYAKTYCGTYYTQSEDCSYTYRWGPPETIISYMRNPAQAPLMTESDLIPQMTFSDNGYAKPAAGLVMLREHVLGPKAFDQAFSGYSQGWAFKHPMPSDFFRSMDEGAGENLAWFWRGWFYTTHANDQAIAGVTSQAADSLVGDSSRGAHYYRITVTNEGGLLMPVELEVTFDDGTVERMDLPAEVWRYNELEYTKGFFSDRKVIQVVVDPDASFTDINRDNNTWTAPEIRQAGEG